MNVLLNCAGRRNYLVQFFHQALEGRGQVFAADASPAAPAMQEADRSFILPAINDPTYIDALLAICRENRVRLLIPLNDLELLPLSTQRQRFLEAGILPVVSAPEVIRICRDKWATLDFLRRSGLQVPRTYLGLAQAQDALARHEVSFPLVVKPRWGSASVGITYVRDEQDLKMAYRLVSTSQFGATPAQGEGETVLVQEQFTGQEYGLDVVNDLDGNYVTTFARKKLAMRAGETDQASTVVDEQLSELGRAIGRGLGHVGNLDCDLFLESGGSYVLEMNARFGGGYPFSHLAGADLPAALIAWAEGRQPDARWLTIEPGMTASKCDRLVVSRREPSSADGEEG